MDKEELLHIIFRPDRISTGIEALDVALDGGYKHPGVSVIEGHLVKEKDYLGCAFLTEGTSNLYISTNRDISFLEECREKGIPVKVDKFIDIYSGKSGVEGSTTYIKSPSALSDISLEIGEFLKSAQGTPKILINSFSDLIFYNPLNSLLRFIQFLSSRLKERGGSMLLLADPEVKGDELNVILNSVDEVFIMEKKGEDVYLKGDSLPFPAKVVVGEGIHLM